MAWYERATELQPENPDTWYALGLYHYLATGDRCAAYTALNASYTLGAGRFRVLRKVVLPHAWPGIVDVARINLAAAWVMLVVAELLAAQEGLGFRLVRATLLPGRHDVRDPHRVRRDRRGQ